MCDQEFNDKYKSLLLSMQKKPDSMIRRLVMIKIDHCMLCDDLNVKTKTFSLKLYEGWVYCEKCFINNRIHNAIYHYFFESYVIPFKWIFSSNNFSTLSTNDKFLSFYHCSQKIIKIGKVIRYDCLLVYDDELNQFKLPLLSEDDGIKYYVTLTNLFAHNSGLYEEFINSDNLLNHEDFKFKFSNLPIAFKSNIENACILHVSEIQ